jgi:hypothetical protein
VLRNRRLRDAETERGYTDRGWAAGEPLHYPAPNRMCHGSEGIVSQ